MKRLTAHGRYLYMSDGTPFFYLADTAWELIHQMDREEVAEYLAVRARQGFTVIQTVALAEMDVLRKPNAYGRLPLLCGKQDLPDPVLADTEGEYSYWDHVDFVIEKAAEYDLMIALLPAWGDKFSPGYGAGPCVFTLGNAYQYGRWIGERYASYWNIIWMLGGDRSLDEKTRPIIDRMAEGIRVHDRVHLITFHPPGGHNSTEYLNDAGYIDFHSAQTGHDVCKCLRSDKELLQMSEVNFKPYMDAEPRYEDHPACFSTELGYYWGSAEVRQNAYWNLMAGVCGHTYGNHCVWSVNRKPSDYFPYTWREALTHPGAEQIHFVKELRLRGDFKSFHPSPDILDTSYDGEGHLACAAGEGYCYVYSPLGLPFTVRLEKIAGCQAVLKAFWFDPRTGSETREGIYPRSGKNTFVPPSSGKGHDWVLILET